jgi:hypothetical protein
MARNDSRKIVLIIFLIAAGLVSICLGLTRYFLVLNVRPENQDVNLPAKLALSESQVTSDITIGGLIRTRTGKLQRTYGGPVKPASLCPT